MAVKTTAISNPGSVAQLAQPLLGNNEVEMTAAMVTIATQEPRPHGQPVVEAVEATNMAGISKVDMEVPPAEEGLLPGSKTTMLHPRLLQAVNMAAMEDSQVDTGIRPVGMADSKAWELLPAWEVVLVVLVLHLVWVLCSRTTGQMDLVLHLHLLRMIYLLL